MPKFDHEMKILRLLGTVWAQNYKNNAPQLATIEANLDLLKQAQIDMQETVDCADRHTVPIHHTELYLPVIVRECEIPRFEGLCALPLLVNRLTNPSLVLHSGMDYTVTTNGGIYLVGNPFESEFMPATGAKGEREALLWGIGAKFDRKYLARHFGYLIGLEKASSESYHDLLNAIFDTWAFGTTPKTLVALANALLGVPLAQNDGEAVEGLYFDARGPFVATDTQIYRIPANASDRVLRGQRLYRGDPVVKLAELVDSSLHSNVVILRAPKEGLDTTLLRQALSPDVELQIE